MSTSKLQRQTVQLISMEFGKHTIRENIHPEWLYDQTGIRLELDVFIEELEIAIEIQGEQHERFIPHFHSTYDEFKKQCEYDAKKKKACEDHGITLLYVYDELSLDDAREYVRGANSSCSTEEVLRPDPTIKKPPHGIALANINRQIGRAMVSKSEVKIHNAMQTLRAYIIRHDLVLRANFPHTYMDLINHLNALGKEARVLREIKHAEAHAKLVKHSKTYHRAKRLLKSNLLSDNVYCVTGGEQPHIVILENEKFKCDCQAFVDGATERCSHIYRVNIDWGDK